MDETTKKLESEVEADPQNKEKLRELIQHYERIGWNYKGKSIQDWIEALESGDDDEEIEAAKALKELGPKAFQATDLLCERLSSHYDEFSRNEALEVLVAIGEPTEATREYFLDALLDEYERTRLNAAFALKITSHNLLGLWNEKTPGELKSALHSEDWQIRAFAMRNLLHNIEDEPGLLPDLLTLFNDQDERVQEALSEALEDAYYEDSVTETMFFELFRQSSDAAKSGLLNVMIGLLDSSEEIFALLHETLQSDMQASAKARILRSLIEFDGPVDTLIPILLTLLENEPQGTDFKLALFEVLHAHEELPSSEKPPFLSLLVEQLGNAETTMIHDPGSKILELEELGARRLVECLSSEDESQVRAALETLGGAYEYEEIAVAALLDILNSNRTNLWEPALNSLNEVGDGHVGQILACCSPLLSHDDCPSDIYDTLQSLAFADIDPFLNFIKEKHPPGIRLNLLLVLRGLLGEDKDKAILEALKEFVDDENQEVQEMARDLLNQFQQSTD